MDRTGLARAYYASLDDHDYERLASILAEGFVHDRPDLTLSGRDRFVRFMREERPDPDTTHEVEGIYRSEDGVAVTGRLLTADDALLTSFCDAFSFAEAKTRSDERVIRRITTYTQME